MPDVPASQDRTDFSKKVQVELSLPGVIRLVAWSCLVILEARAFVPPLT